MVETIIWLCEDRSARIRGPANHRPSDSWGKKYAISAPSPSLGLDCQLGEIKVHFFGDFSAVAYGTENSMRKNADGTRRKRCLAWADTWLKRSGQWRIVAAQNNEVACP